MRYVYRKARDTQYYEHSHHADVPNCGRRQPHIESTKMPTENMAQYRTFFSDGVLQGQPVNEKKRNLVPKIPIRSREGPDGAVIVKIVFN